MDWDLTSFFAEFRGPDMVAFRTDLQKRMQEARERFAELDPLSSDGEDDWEAAILSYEEILGRISHLDVYVICLTAADARNEDYLSEEAALASLGADREILRSQLLQGLQSASQEDLEALLKRKSLARCEYAVRELWQKARQRMSLAEETLASELSVDGLGAWSRLYGNLSGSLEFTMEFPDGETKQLPISQCRSLMTHPDRRMREAAFRGGNEAWSSVSLTTKSALNAIAGTRLTLYEKRGVRDFLDEALSDGHLTRATLDALFEAIDDSLETSRSMVRYKAERMGEAGIAWYDLEAPIPLPEKHAEGSLDWGTAVSWVSQAFHAAYPALGDFFDEICEKKWIDWRQRPGKRPGGFCATSDYHGESRIFMTFNECAHDMMTLAHEVGHAWHSRILQDFRPLAKGYPMTLAESASTFAELILVNGMLQDEGVDDAIKLALADQALGHSSAFLLDIPVRFHFEREFYERRSAGELSVSELNELMIATQRRVFGEALLEGEEYPLFWASKGHFYIDGVSFYNFPYTFGYLLSRALTQMLQTQGASFLDQYEEFLRLSGQYSCEEVVAKSLDRDIEDAAFWKESIASLADTFEQARELVERVEAS